MKLPAQSLDITLQSCNHAYQIRLAARDAGLQIGMPAGEIEHSWVRGCHIQQVLLNDGARGLWEERIVEAHDQIAIRRVRGAKEHCVVHRLVGEPRAASV